VPFRFAFDERVREVEDHVKGMTAERAQENWRLMLKDKESSG
jgi:hypothetical protein